MKRVVLLGILVALGACARPGGTVVTPSESGGNRADGIVAQSAITLLYQPTLPDWSVAAAGAEKRCKAWGHDGHPDFSGWRDWCQGWDAYGRCISTRTTRYYQCGS
jgi:hypothetical protein